VAAAEGGDALEIEGIAEGVGIITALVLPGDIGFLEAGEVALRVRGSLSRKTGRRRSG